MENAGIVRKRLERTSNIAPDAFKCDLRHV